MKMNDLLYNDADNLIFPDVFPIEPPSLMTSLSDINVLSSRLEHLSLEVNTQSLRIEVERVINIFRVPFAI